MDEFERGMVSLLDEAVPEPRHEIEIEDVRGLTRFPHAPLRWRVRQAARRRRQQAGITGPHRRRLAVVASIAAAATIAAGSYVLARNGAQPSVATQPGPSSQTTRPSVTTDPAELTSSSWKITEIIGRNGAGPEAASAPVAFTFANSGSTDHAGSGASTHITAGRIEFGTWVNDLMTNHGPSLDIAQSNFVYGLMAGRLDWSITGDTLTLTRRGLGSLVFVRTRDSANLPYGFVSGRFLAVGGPAGIPSPRPMQGTGTVRFTNTGTGDTQIIDTSTMGTYGGAIAPGRYTVVGYLSNYQGGHAQCAASRPVVIEENRSTKADVYCQER